MSDYCDYLLNYKVLASDVMNYLETLELHESVHRIRSIHGGSFLKPIWFEVKEPVASFTGRKSELVNLHNSLCRNDGYGATTTVVCGLGGIGKSELARKYAHEYCDYYGGNTIWMNADSLESIRNSLVDLAIKHFQVTEDKVKSLSDVEIFKIVFQKFENHKCLIIFDNIEDVDIFKILPQTSSPKVMKPNILVTSRNLRWCYGVDVLPLNILSLEETLQFLKTCLSIPTSSDDHTIKLANALQCLPLALQQAMSYINSELTVVSNPILKYLEVLGSERAKELLEYKDDDLSDYETTTFTTWTITMNNISGQNFGPLAIRIMNVVSCFASEDIPVQVFGALKICRSGSSEVLEDADKSTSEREPFENVARAVALLKKYSMVTGDRGIINVHGVVKRVALLKLRSGTESVLNEGLDVLYQNLTADSLTHTNFKKSLLPHVESVWRLAVNFEKLLKKYSDLPRIICTELEYYGRSQAMLQLARDSKSVLSNALGKNDEKTLHMGRFEVIALHLMKKYLESFDISKETYQIVKEVLGNEHYLTISMRNAMGLNLLELGQYEEAIALYDELLVAQLAKDGPRHEDTMGIMHNKSIALFYLNKLDESLAMFEKLYKMRKEVLGPDDAETLKDMSWIAKIYQEKGEIDTAIKMYEELYESRIKVLGEEHPDSVDILKQINICRESLPKTA